MPSTAKILNVAYPCYGLFGVDRDESGKRCQLIATSTHQSSEVLQCDMPVLACGRNRLSSYSFHCLLLVSKVIACP